MCASISPAACRACCRAGAGAVSWELDTRGVAFDVDVAASYGVPLRRAAADVREQVAAAVIGMTGLPVRSVDVTVTGVER